MGHGRALLGLEKSQQGQAAARVVARKMTVRATEKLVKSLRSGTNRKQMAKDPDIERLETQLGEQLGADVRIRHKKNGKGQLVISYTTLDELQGIIDRVR